LAGRHETVIVGGGIAGLACARQLSDARRPFLLITEDVGGRIRSSSDGAANLGAYYVRADYHHVCPFVERGRRIRRRQMLRGRSDGSFTRSDAPLLRNLPQTIRFVRIMREFRRHYDRFKQECLEVSQASAIEADPLLAALYREPARQFVQRNRIDDISSSFLAPAIHATGFTSLDGLTAFTLLVGVLPTVTPTFEFTFRPDRVVAGFEDQILIDSVTGIIGAAGGYLVGTGSNGTVAADNVVVATPTHVTGRLLDLGPTKTPLAAHMFVVDGALRLPWSKARYTLFPEDHPFFAMAQLPTGKKLVSTASADPDLSPYFERWEVVEHVHWNPAFHLGGDALLECEHGPGLFVVGDHNVCDLEDTFISGVHAASEILRGRPG
jgi:NAD(P)-binding Rossmann-like domain